MPSFTAALPLIAFLAADAVAGCACSKVKATEETAGLFRSFLWSATLLLGVTTTIVVVAIVWFRRALRAGELENVSPRCALPAD